MEFIIKSKKYGDQTVLIDYEDYEKIKNFKWSVSKKVNSFYVMRTEKDSLNIKHKVRLHRVIMNCPRDKIIDHINGNTLDNRKCNLRICTKAENSKNMGGRPNTSSKYKGVYYDKKEKIWRASISSNKKRVKLGRFKNEIDAAMAFNKASLKYYGEFGRLNII